MGFRFCVFCSFWGARDLLGYQAVSDTGSLVLEYPTFISNTRSTGAVAPVPLGTLRSVIASQYTHVHELHHCSTGHVLGTVDLL